MTFGYIEHLLILNSLYLYQDKDRDIFINELIEGIILHSSLSLYREFKKTFELHVATYLQKVESPKLRKFLSKFDYLPI